MYHVATAQTPCMTLGFTFVVLLRPYGDNKVQWIPKSSLNYIQMLHEGSFVRLLAF